MRGKIDIEKNHLVIYRNMQGEFNGYQWFSVETHSAEEIAAKIIEYNQKTAEQNKGYERTAEFITDRLVREICAQKTQERETEKPNKEAREKIKRAIEFLEDAIDYLDE